MPATAEQSEWVQRVLDVAVATSHPAVYPVWETAMESIHIQIAAMQTTLRDFGTEVSINVAEHGLDDIGSRWDRRLTNVLLAYDNAGAADRPAQAQRLTKTCRSVLAEVAKDPVVALLDRNPLRTRVSIAPIINDAISEIMAAVPGTTE